MARDVCLGIHSVFHAPWEKRDERDEEYCNARAPKSMPHSDFPVVRKLQVPEPEGFFPQVRLKILAVRVDCSLTLTHLFLLPSCECGTVPRAQVAPRLPGTLQHRARFAGAPIAALQICCLLAGNCNRSINYFGCLVEARCQIGGALVNRESFTLLGCMHTADAERAKMLVRHLLCPLHILETLPSSWPYLEAVMALPCIIVSAQWCASGLAAQRCCPAVLQVPTHTSAVRAPPQPKAAPSRVVDGGGSRHFRRGRRADRRRSARGKCRQLQTGGCREAVQSHRPR